MMEMSNRNRLDDHLHLCSKECAEAEKQDIIRWFCCGGSLIRAWGVEHVCRLKEVAATKCRFAGNLMALI
jgi:hypothetical protein